MDLSTHSGLSASADSLSDKTSKGGMLGKIFWNPFASFTQDKEREKDLSGSAEKLTFYDKHFEDKKVKSNLKERKEKTETPAVPPKPTEEELKVTASPARLKKIETDNHQDQSNDKCLKVGECLLTGKNEENKDREEALVNPIDNTAVKMKKTKKHNPFMPHNVGSKGQAMQKKGELQQGTINSDETENQGGTKSLFDQLEEFRVNPTEMEKQNMDDLMAWWSTVEQWEDMPQDDVMTEKQEAKAFAGTAVKVQKGIRVFNKLFSERAESLWKHVIDLNSIADALDSFSKKTKIVQITGGSTSALGGVCTIVGLALAPVTLGTSLIVTAVGLGVATAGGLASAGAGISNTVNDSLDRKKVEAIVTDFQGKMSDINKCMLFIKQGIESLRRFDLLKMKKHAYNRDFPGFNNIYEDGAMAGKAILVNASELMRVMQIANVAGSTAARAVQIASMATGVLTGLFVAMDIYFVAQDSKELKKGAKSEFAAKIREVASQLHDGLVELNSIRVELHSTNTPDNSNKTNVDPKSNALDSASHSTALDSSDDGTDNHKTSNVITDN
ncbi:apolipoprotein L1 isoform X2 [Esox lucius]|uniref:Apolipoprotein L, 1 n=1 Tax=Esox lucius TaxID=8010 RepID=A0AAY5KMB2_ESOLU|nr:apolipoprotein L1 isoform X2 [Esox lucius]